MTARRPLPEAEFLPYLARTNTRLTPQVIEHARQDSAAFCEAVLRDESTGGRITLTPMHVSWHEAARQYDRLVILSFLEAGKTANMSVGRTLWRIGQDPSRRVVIVSDTDAQVRKVVRLIKQYVEHSAALHQIFPGLHRARDSSMPWGSKVLTVDRPTWSKDPTVQGTSMHGNPTGSRIDDLVLDDCLDTDNSMTAGGREAAWRYLRSTLLGRVKQTVIGINNALHPKDAMHTLVSESGYHFIKQAVLDEKGESVWPAVWSAARIAKARRDLGPFEFNRQLMSIARTDDDSKFKMEWITQCALLGRGYRLVRRVDDLPPGYRIFIGVDLGTRKTSKSDWTVFFVLLLHPNGKRQVLWIERFRAGGPDIVAKLDEFAVRYPSALFVVENVAAQNYLLEFAETMTRATIVPFTTGANKAHLEFGVESLAGELADGRWIIPSGNGGELPKVIELWVDEMIDYDPAQHTGDVMMASWFAREGARRYGGQGGADRKAVGARVIVPSVPGSGAQNEISERDREHGA